MANNGYSPVPLRPCTKQPRFPKWQHSSYAAPNPGFIARHAKNHSTDSVGLATGRVRDGDEVIGSLLVFDCDRAMPAPAARWRGQCSLTSVRRLSYGLDARTVGREYIELQGQ